MAKIILLFALNWLGSSGSGVGHHVSEPVVTASSSQYFARTFNRLVEAPTAVVAAPVPAFRPIVVAPVQPVTSLITPVTRPTIALPDAISTSKTNLERPNIITATAEASALTQPFLLSAPVPIQASFIAPQFELLPLAENAALNSIDNEPQNLQKFTNSKTTVTSNTNFQSNSNFEYTNQSTQLENNNELTQTELEERLKHEEYLNQQAYLQQLLKAHQEEYMRQQQILQQELYKNKQLLSKQQQIVNQQQRLKQEEFVKQQQYYKHQQSIIQQQRIKKQELMNQQQYVKQQQFIKQQQQFINQQQLKRQSAPIKSTVEIIPVPLAYIAPPPLRLISPINQVRAFLPTSAKLTSRPIPFRLPSRIPDRLTAYNAGALGLRPAPRDIEPTTLRIPRFNNVTRPPRK